MEKEELGNIIEQISEEQLKELLDYAKGMLEKGEEASFEEVQDSFDKAVANYDSSLRNLVQR